MESSLNRSPPSLDRLPLPRQARRRQAGFG